MTTVRYDAVGGVATITLDRPASLNALTDEVMLDVLGALGRVVEDESVRVAVLTGAGRGFCSGADLRQVAAPAEAAADPAPVDSGDNVFNRAMAALHDLPVPTIARVQGVAAGGGVGLALACDVTVMARSAYLVCTFGPRLGIVPDLGVTWQLPRRAGRARALGMALLGDRITADQAVAWGLVWSVVDDERLDGEVADLAARLARSSPDAVVRTRRTIDAALADHFDEALAAEMRHQAVLIERNMVEGARAFLERREPTFDGARTPRH
ncbi:MAG: enoyl-CoA hydratase/isomerase family protein [Acidimicrobiales bacterium]